MIKRGWCWAAFVTALVGVADSLLATVMHTSILTKGFDGKSFCAISPAFDCDTVLASSYSSVLGIPIAGLALTFYIIIALYTAFALWLEGGGRARIAFAAFLSLPALIVTGVMAYLSIAILETVCLICAVAYLVNLALFIFLFKAADVRLKALPSFTRTYLTVAFRHSPDLEYRPALLRHSLFTLVLFAIGGLLFFSIARGAQGVVKPGQLARYVTFHRSQRPTPLDVSGRPAWGAPPETAPRVTVVEFSDFQCPFCRRAAFFLKPYLGEYRKNVRLAFVNYPLHNACNPSVPGTGHPFACEAARYGLCAAEQGRFWEMHDAMFEDQKRLSSETLKIWAARVGLEPERLEACLASPQTEERLAADVALGASASVQGTPTIFVNGRRLEAWHEPRALRAVIEAEIKRDGTD